MKLENNYRTIHTDQVAKKFVEDLQKALSSGKIKGGALDLGKINKELENQLAGNGKSTFIQLLAEKKIVHEKSIRNLIAFIYRFGMMNESIDISPDIFSFLPKSVTPDTIALFRVIPISSLKGELQFMTPEIPSPFFLKKLKYVFQVDEVVPLITTFSYYEEKFQLLEKIYKSNLNSQLQGLAESSVDLTSLETEKDINKLAKDKNMVQIVDNVFLKAFRSKGSDIHITSQEDHVLVRLRVDGALVELYSLPFAINKALIARIKVLSNLDITNTFEPQDGRISLTIIQKGKNAMVAYGQGEAVAGGGKVLQEQDIRVSTIKTIHGESVVMRVLNKSKEKISLEDLGFSGKNVANFRNAIKNSYGLFLVTGPTGSGKSSSLYGALEEINTPEKKIITVEDPVEYKMKILDQVQINPDRGLTFSGALRSILRQDPDVIMVGEIRDAETGSIAAEAALTGHVVLSTLHSNDAPSTINRMINIGVPPFLLAPSIIGVLAQRLIRRLCPFCATLRLEDQESLKYFGIEEPQKLRNKGVFLAPSGKTRDGKTCPNCLGVGYKGRSAIHEILMVNNEIRELIYQRAPSTVIEKVAMDEGYEPLQFDGLLKAVAGITSLDELKKITNQSEEPLAGEQLKTLNDVYKKSMKEKSELMISIKGQEDLDPIFKREGAAPRGFGKKVEIFREKKFTCLVVEDSSNYRKFITDYLGGMGCVTEEAETGEAALKKIKVAKPDIVTLDYNLGKGMTGLETLEKLKAMVPEDCILTMLSSIRSKDLAFKAQELGAENWVLKDTQDAMEELMKSFVRSLQSKARRFSRFKEFA